MSGGPSMWLRHQFYNRLLGSVVPVSWFAPVAPRPEELQSVEGELHLQLVSHCWQYAHLLLFQLSSLANYPPRNLKLTYTLYYAEEDKAVCELIKHFDAMHIPNVSWDWQVLPRTSLFRRAIGRHRSSISSCADWLWFTDCDLIFHEGCLDSVAAAVASLKTGLVYPDHEGITDLLTADHPLLNPTPSVEGLVDVDTRHFHDNAISKAKGAFQIVHGDVARQAGYCGSLKLYQQPTDAWRKTFEDVIFRRLIEYEGEPIPVQGLYRMRHAAKGRYSGDTTIGQVRGQIRQATDKVCVKSSAKSHA